MSNKISSYVGLAQRCNSVRYGEDAITERLKVMKVVLIDCSAPEKFKLRLKAECGDVPSFEVENLKEMTHREQVQAIGVTNAELAKAIIERLR